MDFVSTDSFQPQTLDKVDRLFDVLDEMDRHPLLHGKLAMHGGTAINLFMLDIPRLSVDIDVSYIGAIDRGEMLAERPLIEQAIEEVGRELGYSVASKDGGHAGRTFTFGYAANWGTDIVKVDCIYLNRSPLLAPAYRTSPYRPEVNVLMFDDIELAGGKVKAFFDRVKIRDLYDISTLMAHLDSLDAETRRVAHEAILFYASVSARFPQPFERRSERFSDRQNELEDQLIPMLRNRSDGPSLEHLMKTAEEFVSAYVLPRGDSEVEYLERLAKGDFKPELLFSDSTMAQAAVASPEALWKLQNLRKMK